VQRVLGPPLTNSPFTPQNSSIRSSLHLGISVYNFHRMENLVVFLLED